MLCPASATQNGVDRRLVTSWRRCHDRPEILDIDDIPLFIGPDAQEEHNPCAGCEEPKDPKQRERLEWRHYSQESRRNDGP